MAFDIRYFHKRRNTFARERERERLIKFRKLKHHLLKVFERRGVAVPKTFKGHTLGISRAHITRNIFQARNRPAILFAAWNRDRGSPADLDDGQPVGKRSPKNKKKIKKRSLLSIKRSSRAASSLLSLSLFLSPSGPAAKLVDGHHRRRERVIAGRSNRRSDSAARKTIRDWLLDNFRAT